jgi:RNA polymerase sigma factor (sigma-70 family)
MGNKHDAMDALEEMILTLYEKIRQLKKEEAFYSWSKTILVNSCKRLLKKRKKIVLVDEWSHQMENGVASRVVNDPFIKSEQQIDLHQQLSRLNDHQKESIQLKYFHDLDYQTIADMTGVSVGTVKSRIFQGLKKMKEHSGGERNE